MKALVILLPLLLGACADLGIQVGLDLALQAVQSASEWAARK